MSPLQLHAANYLALKGRRPGDAGRQGRGRCPRARPHQLGSRAVRASCLPALRPACEVRRWKWADRRRSDPRPLDGLPTKPGPDRTKGPHTPWEEPWWNAGRRARPIAEGAAQAAPSVARPARRMRAGLRPAFAGVPLPFICRKRVAKSCSATARSGPLWIRWLAGPRGKQNTLFDIARGRGARARTGLPYIRPRERGRGTIRSSRSERRMVEGASEMELRCRRRTIVAARTPPTALRAVPPPRWRGAG